MVTETRVAERTSNDPLEGNRPEASPPEASPPEASPPGSSPPEGNRPEVNRPEVQRPEVQRPETDATGGDLGARPRDEAPPSGTETSEGLSTLSPSRASDFKQCPQLFKFRSIDRIPEPVTVYQARGTTAHLALERLYDLPHDQRTPDRLYELFRAAWTEIRNDEEFGELFDTVDDERAWGVESLELLANYFAIEDPRKVAPLERELDLIEDIEHMTIRGILDRIDERPNGDLVITDYKTGRAPPERYALTAFFALKIYALLVRNRLGRAPVELRLLYLNGPTLYRLGVDDRQLDAMDRQLQALWDRIERAISDDRFPPRPGRLCDWCSYQDLCPAFADGEQEALSAPARRSAVAVG